MRRRLAHFGRQALQPLRTEIVVSRPTTLCLTAHRHTRPDPVTSPSGTDSNQSPPPPPPRPPPSNRRPHAHAGGSPPVASNPGARPQPSSHSEPGKRSSDHPLQATPSPRHGFLLAERESPGHSVALHPRPSRPGPHATLPRQAHVQPWVCAMTNTEALRALSTSPCQRGLP